jgi:hypothetical protein
MLNGYSGLPTMRLTSTTVSSPMCQWRVMLGWCCQLCVRLREWLCGRILRVNVDDCASSRARTRACADGIADFCVCVCEWILRGQVPDQHKRLRQLPAATARYARMEFSSTRARVLPRAMSRRTVPDECERMRFQPCANGGVCVDGRVASLHCACVQVATAGLQCQTSINDCASSPCQNGGSMHGRRTSYTIHVPRQFLRGPNAK